MKFKQACPNNVNTVPSESPEKKLSIDLDKDIKKLDKEAQKHVKQKENWNKLHAILMGL